MANSQMTAPKRFSGAVQQLFQRNILLTGAYASPRLLFSRVTGSHRPDPVTLHKL